jgi:hypothetical protein
MAQALNLDATGVRITGADWEHTTNSVILYLEGGDLPEVLEGNHPIFVTLVTGLV